jgi:hypothetical protein
VSVKFSRSLPEGICFSNSRKPYWKRPCAMVPSGCVMTSSTLALASAVSLALSPVRLGGTPNSPTCSVGRCRCNMSCAGGPL